MNKTVRKSKILDVSFEVEVVYDSRRAAAGTEDADGNREYYATEWIVREVEVLTAKVPPVVERFLIDCAVDQFNSTYND